MKKLIFLCLSVMICSLGMTQNLTNSVKLKGEFENVDSPVEIKIQVLESDSSSWETISVETYDKKYKLSLDPTKVYKIEFKQGDFVKTLYHYNGTKGHYATNVLDVDFALSSNCIMVHTYYGYKFEKIEGNDPPTQEEIYVSNHLTLFK